MPRYKLTVAYDGTNFHGWQKQHPKGRDPLRTAQQVLEDAVRFVVREEVNVHGASRTDSGVHAVGQVAAFSCWTRLDPARMRRAINSRLPDDIQVQRARFVRDSFNPISDAVEKGYRYRLAHGCKEDTLPPLFDRHYTTWTPYQLDIPRMQRAAKDIIGEHDFTSFTRLHHGRESPVRTVTDCAVTASSKHRCRIDVSGNGFLYNMVRIIAGTLLDVGRGAIEPDTIPDILAARDRQRAGTTLPPHGLCLMWIKYGRKTK